MMGIHQPQESLFSYRVNLEQRIRQDHPLRRVAQLIDFTFVRAEVARFYGKNGNEGVDPVILVKLMFLLFFDDVPSERELMERLPERLDYLWFLGYNLEDDTPNHSVLSKARCRWGRDVFENIFLRTVQQCVEAGLVDGKKIHVDSSFVAAHASRDSVVKASPELIAAAKQAYQAQEKKLENTATPAGYEAINDRMLSTTDPDAAMVRHRGDASRPRYHHHRAIDNAHGVITAVETTPGSIAENSKLMDLVQQHQDNTSIATETVVADSKYGTTENYVACQKKDIQTHLGDVLRKQNHEHHRADIFSESDFKYRAQDNTYLCPAGEVMKARRVHPQKRTWEYFLPKGVCAACALRKKCTRSKTSRTVQRHEHQELVDRARAQGHSRAGKADRRRRQYLMEQSFADAANNHGFKRSRWRRLWRQEIQDWMIAGIQNIRILVARIGPKRVAAAEVVRLPEILRHAWLLAKKIAMLCTLTVEATHDDYLDPLAT